MTSILDGPLTSLALCWRIERSDGAGLALTSHDSVLSLGGRSFEAAPGMIPAAIQRRAGLEPSGSEVAGAISTGSLEEADLSLGRWDGARIELLAVDWDRTEVQAISLSAGELGEVRLEDGEFKAELRGASARLEAAVCPETSPECRAELGDKKCRVGLAGRSILAQVVQAEGHTLVLDRSVTADFLWGRARFMSGENCGLASVTVKVDANRTELRDRPRGEVKPGDWLELRHGCDKSFATCTGRFANAANFRGEPHLPGNDLLTRYPGG